MWLWVVGLHAVMSLVAFTLYGLDKRRAARGRWRIAESTLHLAALCFGYAGAFVGQRVFRHKTRKLWFQVAFWMIVALHAAGWTLWFIYWPGS